MAEGDDRTTSSSSNTATSSNRCPICLGPFIQESSLDQCFHTFCYSCILRWSKVASYKLSLPPSSVKCPLCKTENFSLIHGYDGISFQQHYFGQDTCRSSFFTDAHKYRLQCYYTESDSSLTDRFKVSHYWKFRQYLRQNRWLQNWLRREIQALIQEEDVEIIVHHILGVINSLRSYSNTPTSTEASQEHFKILVSKAVRPFTVGRADRFVDELELFLASGLNVEAYDKVYMLHLGWKKVLGTESDANEEREQFDSQPKTRYLHLFDEDSDGAE